MKASSSEPSVLPPSAITTSTRPANSSIRPICFSGKTFKSLPADLQAAIVKAGKEAGAYGRQIESSEDSAKLDALEKAGKLKRIPFKDRAEMEKLVAPVMAFREPSRRSEGR